MALQTLDLDEVQSNIFIDVGEMMGDGGDFAVPSYSYRNFRMNTDGAV